MLHYGAALELKTVDVSQRIISGYAAYHNNLDRVGDIIDPSASVKAVARLAAPSDVAVFVGHDSSALPVGIPLKIDATPAGLYTETLIKPGPVGDDLLATAKFLQDHGQCLGLSIGYQTKASKPDRVQGKTVRRLMDYALKEFSYAASQVIANPKALVSSVKSRKAKAASSDTAGGYITEGDEDSYHVEVRNGRHHVVGSDGTSVCDFATQVEANAALTALGGAAKEDMGEEGEPANDDDPINKTAQHWSTATVNTLKDSCFLYIERGGVQDDEGKTTPRSLRHLPYRDDAGALDLAHLRDAIGCIPQMNGIDDAAKARLGARARKMLEDAGSGKSTEEAEEWKGGPLTIRALGYALLDLSETAADEMKAMTLLGESTKDGYRLRAPLRAELARIVTEANRIAEWSATIDKGEDEAAKVAWYRHRLALAGS